MSWIIQQAKAETEDPLAYGRAIQAVIIKADRLGLNDIAQNAIDTLETIAPRIKTKKIRHTSLLYHAGRNHLPRISSTASIQWPDMILYPAIDIKDGVCVRLLRGEMSEVTVYNQDVAAQAVEFQDQGFEWLHLVDLNGAIEGQSVNHEAIARVLASIDIPVQLGGGIRNRSRRSRLGWPAAFRA